MEFLTLEDWLEWERQCASERCLPATRDALRAFAATRFHRFLRRYAYLANLGEVAAVHPGSREAWDRFEAFLALRTAQGCKARKAWIFGRARLQGTAALDAVQSGATLIMRDVVREYLRQECRPADTLGLDVPRDRDGGDGGDGEPLPLVELLPDRMGGEEVLGMVETVAAGQALGRDFFPKLTRRERMALLARRLDCSFAHPCVVRAAGCGKSQIYSVYHALLQALAGRARERLVGEDSSWIFAVTLQALEQLGVQVVAWGRLEKRLAPLFRGERRVEE